jgi:hypothetical protein
VSKDILNNVQADFDHVERKMKILIKNPLNVKEHWGKNLFHAQQFLLNSSTRVSSVINRFFKACSDQTKSYLFSFAGLDTIPNDSDFLTTHSYRHQQTDLNSSLLLLDMIVRKIKKTQPQQHFNFTLMSMLSAQGIALNIVNECEQVLDCLMGRKDYAFDFLALQKQLFKQLMQVESIESIEVIREDVLETITKFYIDFV